MYLSTGPYETDRATKLRAPDSHSSMLERVTDVTSSSRQKYQGRIFAVQSTRITNRLQSVKNLQNETFSAIITRIGDSLVGRLTVGWLRLSPRLSGWVLVRWAMLDV